MTVGIDAKKKRIGCCAHKARGRAGAGGWSRDLLLHNKLPPNAVASTTIISSYLSQFLWIRTVERKDPVRVARLYDAWGLSWTT